MKRRWHRRPRRERPSPHTQDQINGRSPLVESPERVRVTDPVIGGGHSAGQRFSKTPHHGVYNSVSNGHPIRNGAGSTALTNVPSGVNLDRSITPAFAGTSSPIDIKTAQTTAEDVMLNVQLIGPAACGADPAKSTSIVSSLTVRGLNR